MYIILLTFYLIYLAPPLLLTCAYIYFSFTEKLIKNSICEEIADVKRAFTWFYFISIVFITLLIDLAIIELYYYNTNEITDFYSVLKYFSNSGSFCTQFYLDYTNIITEISRAPHCVNFTIKSGITKALIILS